MLDQAIALHKGGALTLAQLLYEDVLKVQPTHAHALNLLGGLLSQGGDHQRGLALLQKATTLAPGNPVVHANRGLVLKEMLQLDAALASFDKAIALKPDYAVAHWNRAMVLLLSGRFESGWQAYEWRWQCVRQPRDVPQPLWLGGVDDLHGKTILLHAEQGLGDTLQFCRYATALAQQGAQVLLEVPHALAGLMHSLEGPAQVVTAGAALPAFDFHCPLLSLPYAFQTRLATVPAWCSYLRSEPQKRAAWAERLGTKTKLRVGVAWSGSPQHPDDRKRSLPLTDVMRLVQADCEWVSLQKDVRHADKPHLDGQQCRIRHFGDDLRDFSDTAALCDLMDLTLSVDTSVAHLSAALGKPTWVLLPQCPDWRWLLGRDDSPWYPTAKLYRQSSAGDWRGVLDRIGVDLAPLAAAAQRA